jgi:hypothetical protein
VVLVKELEEAKEASASASDITDGLKKVLADTKLFAKNLDALRSSGLDAKVYEQIVAAGMEVGNKTAQAILDGGPEVIAEINSLWASIGSYSEVAAVTAADKVFGLGGNIIEATIDGLRSKDANLSQEAAQISTNMVNAFQSSVTAYKVNLDNLLLDLKSKESALVEIARQMGAAFAAELQRHIGGALRGVNVPVPNASQLPVVPQPVVPVVPVAPVPVVPTPVVPTPTEDPFKMQGVIDISTLGGDLAFLIDSASDITKIVAYLNQRVIAANEFAANSLREGNRAASLSAQATAQEMLATLKEVRAMTYTGTPTVVNINVKADTTQSLAMVGKTIGRTVTKYVTGGGGILVSPVG